jgi:hypothetical protein
MAAGAIQRLLANDQGEVRSGWKVLAFALLWALLSDLARLLHPAGAAAPPGWLPHEWFGAATVLAASAVCLRAEGAPWSGIGLRLDRRWVLQALLGAALGLGLMVATALAARAFGAFHWVRTPDAGVAGAVLGLWIYLAVAVHEELLFRGFPYFRLQSGAGPVPALLATSALFALAHGQNPGMAGAVRIWALVNIGLAGLLLGLCAWRTGSLALPVGVHLGWNWAQGSLLGFGVSGTEARGWWTPVFHEAPPWLAGGDFGLEASLPCALLTASACLALVAWPRRRPDPPSGDPATGPAPAGPDPGSA